MSATVGRNFEQASAPRGAGVPSIASALDLNPIRLCHEEISHRCMTTLPPLCSSASGPMLPCDRPHSMSRSDHYCPLHDHPPGDGFVRTERRLVHNLLLLSIASGVSLSLVHTLLSLDRYFYGPWTFIGLSVAFIVSALSVYYAQACVTRFGPNRILALAAASIVLFVLVHFSSNFLVFQLGALLFALAVGPFYAAQLDFISSFISRLVHLTPVIKRYQEERYQRIFHLLLFCPSHIVGHLVFIVLYYASPPTLAPSQHSITAIHHGAERQWGSYAANHSFGECDNTGCHRSPSVSWPDNHRGSLCGGVFREQYCERALYYVFSFHRHPSVVWQPFSASFSVLLISVFVLIAVLVLAAIMLLLQQTNHLQLQDPLERSFLSSSVRNVLFRTLHDHHLRLLLPMAFFVGLEQGFFVADFNKLYVSCALGLDAIGLVMLTRGCVHLGASLLVHEFVRHIHRPLILMAGAICQLGVFAILCLWRPNDDLPLYYVITACWALANAIWETLLLTNVLRTFCSDEWNYALLTLYSFTHLGLGASFGISEFVCFSIKLYFLIVVLLISIVPMKMCELRLVQLETILGPGSASHV